MTITIAFIIFQVSSYETATTYFEDLLRWFNGSDLLMSASFMNVSNSKQIVVLDEVPLANFLDEHKDIVERYSFKPLRLDIFHDGHTVINDLSGHRIYTSKLMYISEYYQEI